MNGPVPAAAGLLSAGALGLLFWGLAQLAGKGFSALGELAARTPELMAGLARGLSALEERAMRAAASAPEELGAYLRAALEAVTVAGGETVVCANAFKGCSALASVSLPEE